MRRKIPLVETPMSTRRGCARGSVLLWVRSCVRLWARSCARIESLIARPALGAALAASVAVCWAAGLAGAPAAAQSADAQSVALAKEPRRKTVRIGMGGDIGLTAPSVWGLRISGRDTVAALASDLALAGAAQWSGRPLRDLSPPPGAKTDQSRLTRAAEADGAAREALAEMAAPRFDTPLARALRVSFMEGRNRLLGDPRKVKRAIRCLAEAIYFEARGESVDGQVAVAEVVLNRVESRHWPNTICRVVNQGAHRRTGCQFSYTCDGKPDRVAPGAAWLQAQRLAKFMMRGGPRRLTGRATHYHADYVDPTWNRTMERTAVVGRHIFYRRLMRMTVE